MYQEMYISRDLFIKRFINQRIYISRDLSRDLYIQGFIYQGGRVLEFSEITIFSDFSNAQFYGFCQT